jgi:hypothetical protein
MKDESVISLRVDKKLHSQMKLHEEINWSAVLRKAIAYKIETLETINKEKAMDAARGIDKIRKSGVFSGGKKSEEIIREWRDRRR